MNFHEQLCLEILKNKGLEIIGQNIRIGRAEIDILCRDKNLIVAVEVKYRKTLNYFPQIDKQIKRISDALNIIYNNCYIRIDFCIFNENGYKYFENITI